MAHDNNKKASDHDLEFTEWLVDILDTCGMDGLIFEGYLGGALEELPKNASMQVIEEKISEVMESYYDDGSEQYAMLLKSVSRRWFEELQKEQEEAANLPPSEVNPFSLPSSSSSSSSAHSSNEGAEATPTTGAVGGRGGGGGGGGGVGEGMSVSEKKHLVALYGCDTEEDYEMDDQELEAAGRYLNKLSVSDAAKLQRELQKTAHLAKLERDKKSRTDQKQKESERQDREKKRTQKQERKR